jgi:hypothetical protein
MAPYLESVKTFLGREQNGFTLVGAGPRRTAQDDGFNTLPSRH